MAALLPYIFASLSGVGLWLAFPGGGAMPQLLPLVLVPLLHAVAVCSLRQATLVGLVGGFVHFLLLLYWIVIVLNTYGGLSWFFSLLVLVLLAAYMSIYIALFAAITRFSLEALPPAITLWLLPALWVGLDWLRSILFSGFPWMDLGYALYNLPTFIQIADLVGHYGLTYLIVMLNLLIFFFSKSRRNSLTQSQLILPVCLLLLVVVYNKRRMQQIQQQANAAPHMTIGVVQGNIDQSVKWLPTQQKTTVDTYLRLSRFLADSSAPSLIVWPETALPVYPLTEDQMAPLHTLLKQGDFALLSGVPLLETINRNITPKLYNSALLLNPDGVTVGTYHKSHLVPFGEYVPLQEVLPFISPLVQAVGNFSAGTIDRPLPRQEAKLGILICFESVFGDLSRQWVKAGANLLLNLTNDAWYGRSSAPYHSLAMAVFRAVETRRSLVRSANTGISAFIEPTGTISEQSEIFIQWTKSSEISLLTGKTVWVRFGYLFAPACLTLSLIISASTLAIRRLRT